MMIGRDLTRPVAARALIGCLFAVVMCQVFAAPQLMHAEKAVSSDKIQRRFDELRAALATPAPRSPTKGKTENDCDEPNSDKAEEWERLYYEPSISTNETEADAFSGEVAPGFECDQPVTGTKHVLRCSANDSAVFGGGFALEPDTREGSDGTIVFAHGLTPASQPAPYLAFLTTILRLLEQAGMNTERLRVVYPLAPPRVLSNSGNPLSGSLVVREGLFRAWYDPKENLTSLEPADLLVLEHDRLGIYRATQRMVRIVKEEYIKHAIPSTRVFLLGHSLGAALSLETSLGTNVDFAGVVSISGFLPRPGDVVRDGPKAYYVRPRNFNLTWIHGTDDPTVDISIGQASTALVDQIMGQEMLASEFIPLEGADHSSFVFEDERLHAELVKRIIRAIPQGRKGN